jgi:hypothetical protein
MKKDPLRIQSHFLLGFLTLEYLFGMFINLFVEFPETKKEKVLWEFAKGQPSIVIHMVIAALLVIGAIVLVIRAIRRKDRYWIIASSIGLVAILTATGMGAQLISTQQDVYSYVMAVAFLLAVFSYGWAIYRAKK